MASSKEIKVGDNFGTFLNTLNDRTVTVDSGSSSSSSQAAPDSDASASGTSVLDRPAPAASLELTKKAVATILKTDAHSVGELQSIMGLGFSEFGELVLTLDQLGLIEISGDPGSELISLTRQGRLFAQMI